MTQALRRVLRFLESARLATWLLVFVGAWSIAATIVPQGESTADAVKQWAAAYPFLEPVVKAIGLHRAFSAPLFRAGVAVLAVSTALCAWRRTKVALGRMRKLRDAASSSADSLVERHDIAIACRSEFDASQGLLVASQTLDRLGLKTKRRDEVLSSVSPWWPVWGSPLFHWGLLAIILVVLLGSLQRSEGLMGVPVGQTKPDAPASYGVLHAGPLHSWSRVHRSIRVDSFETDFRTGKIDRGPTPTVSLLDADGEVVKTQHIYPNSPLQAGSVTIHPADFGFAVDLSLVSATGDVYGRVTELVDILQSAPDGTVPFRAIRVSDQSGQPQARIMVTVPLIHKGDQVVVPEDRTAHVVVTKIDGTSVEDAVLNPGESITLSGGNRLRVENVGFYARLTVVDDATIPFLYASMALALLGLVLTVAFRQQAVVLTAVEGPASPTVYVSMHLWRNVPTTRSEIQSELARALGGDEEGDS